MRFTVIALVLVATPAFADKIVFKSIEDFDRCAAENSYDTGVCMTAAEALLKKKPAQAFELGKRARLHFQHWAALRFFEPALAGKPGARCADQDVGLAVRSGLALPGDYPEFARAKRIFTGACFDALRPVVDKDLSDGGYITDNVCAIYAARKVVEPACTPKPVVVEPVVPEEKLPAFDRSKASIGMIKVYLGPEGERVTIGEVKGQAGLFLIRFDGVRGDNNGKTMLHKEVISGDRIDYWTEVDGKHWTTIAGRKYQGYSDLTAYVPKHPGEFAVRYSDVDSKTAKADVLK
jgi:hypothetical protein